MQHLPKICLETVNEQLISLKTKEKIETFSQHSDFLQLMRATALALIPVSLWFSSLLITPQQNLEPSRGRCHIFLYYLSIYFVISIILLLIYFFNLPALESYFILTCIMFQQGFMKFSSEKTAQMKGHGRQ